MTASMSGDLGFLKDLIAKLDEQTVTRQLPYDAVHQFNAIMARMADNFAKKDNFPNMVKEVIASLGSPIP